MRDLSRRGRVAAFWSFGEVFARQLFQFVISVVLARLLAPEDFGVLAVISLCISVANVFVESGLGQALIQKKEVTETEVSSVFWFNVLIAVLMAAIIFVCSGLVASFFSNSDIKGLLGLMSINLILLGCQSVHHAMLAKALRFRVLMFSSVISTVISGALSIILAWAGFGVWSLAWQSITATAVTGVIVARCYKLPRLFSFGLVELLQLLQFGMWIMFGTLLNALRGGFITILIGKFFSLRDLGFYLRADSTKNIPLALLSSSCERVIFPVFSRASDDQPRLMRGARRAIDLMMFVNVPAMLIIALTADPLIQLLFGSKWSPAAPYLSILCLASLFWPLHVVNVQSLLALGYGKLFFRLDVIKFALAIVISLGASTFGVLALTWAQVLISILSWIVNTVYSGRFLNYGFKAQLIDVFPLLLTAGVASIAALVIDTSFKMQGIAQLLYIPLVFTSVFFLLVRRFQISGYKEIQTLFHAQ